MLGRLRFLKYSSGQEFKPHFDGSYVRDNGERSYWTLMLYLNEGCEGGSTAFLSTHTDEKVEVTPRVGRVLIFQHDLYHSGEPVVSGWKYAMRTDVMFSPQFD
jgi:predicted 2-oxoglutarate/Fe(II)-dependent dioxygenase YbiX